MLTLHGIPIYVSGVPGHFAGARFCSLRLSWRIGPYRVSTIGGYRRQDGTQEEVGLGRYAETYVFYVSDAPGIPEGVVNDWTEIWGEGVVSKDTRVAEETHYRIAEHVAAAVARGVDIEIEGLSDTTMTPDEIGQKIARSVSPASADALRVELDKREAGGWQ